MFATDLIMKQKRVRLSIVLALFVAFNAFTQVAEVINRAEGRVIKGQLIAKIKDEYRGVFYKKEYTQTSIYTLLNKFGVQSIDRKFPLASRPRNLKNNFGENMVDLSGIYTIHYNENFNEFDVAKIFSLTGMFEYVEAQIVPELMYVPNDPKVSIQYHLDLIDVFEAWDIQKGDTNIVIGITDTGIDSDHPEVDGRIKHNYADPIDGIDNDNDGYIDNFSGWDTGADDNDFILLEGDEYLSSAIDSSPKFHHYKPQIALISGISWDHVNVFKTLADYNKQFEIFIDSITPGGVLVFNKEDRTF